MPSVVVSLNLTVNGEACRLSKRFPLHHWDAMEEDERVAFAQRMMEFAAQEIVRRLADQITVARDDMPGATNLQRAGAQLGALLDKYGL